MASKRYNDMLDAESYLVPCPTLMDAQARQRVHDLRKMFNGICLVVGTGSPLR
jgi:hypothetical protein